MMTKEQLVAQALACWICSNKTGDRDIIRQALPEMDVAWFFRALAEFPNFHAQKISMAIVGFDVNEIDLEDYRNRSGLAELLGLTDDLHIAASWRDDRDNHPSIIALAKSWHPGVSTLDHFHSTRSRSLCTCLLDWAEDKSDLPEDNSQRDLLFALRDDDISNFLSLESVCSFISDWFFRKSSDTPNAPHVALLHLGLFYDPDLLMNSELIKNRLLYNFEASNKVQNTSSTSFRTMQKNLKRRFKNKPETRDRLLRICEHISAVRLIPSIEKMASVTLAEVEEIFNPSKNLPTEEGSEDNSHTGEDNDDSERTRNLRDLSAATGGDLLDDKQGLLTERINILKFELEEAINTNEKRCELELEIGGEDVRVVFEVDHALLGWLHTYCSLEVWGGLLHTKEPSVITALIQHETCDHWEVNPSRITVLDGKEMNLQQIFSDWDTQLREHGHTVSILKHWNVMVAERGVLVNHLNVLFHFPLDWMAGYPELTEVVDRYLAAATELYRQVQEHFRDMSDIDQGWAEIALHGLLALDVMQVRCDLGDDRESWKAILLPTHPLHLWRYQRLAAVLRGLGSTLEAGDREAVLDECCRPEQFLSVLFASGLPQDLGGSRLLPISSDTHGLATFENLQNACTGLDGAETIRYVLNRFAVVHRMHLRPLRVGIVNPPSAPRLLVELAKIFTERREQTLPSMRVELFSTMAPAVHNRAAQGMAFSGETMDLLEAHIMSGRLQLQIHEEPLPIRKWINRWQQEPHHILVLFDEASVSIQRSGMGLPMPMSPFCVRKVIRYQKLRHSVRLDPTTDEPPFSEFMQLMNEADSGQRDSTPNAWADAENLREVADDMLQSDEPGAFWLILADRALPAESGLNSVRFLAQREGQREVLLLARDYRKLAEIIRPVFNRWSLYIELQQLSDLLEEGVYLTGSGILNLVKKNGIVDVNQALGLTGTLLVARDYAIRHPDSLIISIDHQIARHWLRLGKRGERCDLLAMRQENEGIILEAVEVKSTQGMVGEISQAKLDKATDQLRATLEAVTDGLCGIESIGGPLSVPRCEMLKEVLVQGCKSRNISDKSRDIWCGLLKRIFRQEGKLLPVTVRGEIVRVAMSESSAILPSSVDQPKFPIIVRTLGEADVQRLLEREGMKVESSSLEFNSSVSALSISPHEEIHTQLTDKTEIQSDVVAPTLDPSAVMPLEDSSIHGEVSNSESETSWPPTLNDLGMIGQDETVRQLINRIHYAKDFKQSFKDTMFVGTAGVGKSSFARAIANQLLGQIPIMFSGADLRNAKMIIDKLQQEDKVPDNLITPILLESCVLFIDEVHALPSSVSNILMSALDDSRLTTIDNTDYDFKQVVFLMATTDAGKLTEAFRSRPDRVLLHNYTLDELAGILWLHGYKELDKYSLSRDVCFEIAARTKAQPRVAIRMLTNQIIPHFYAEIREFQIPPNHHKIGEMMNVKNVAEYFNRQGIDLNGLDSISHNFIKYLSRHGATAEERLRQGLGIPNRGDFVETDEYLQRLGLVIVRGGRSLTAEGRQYLNNPVDLRHRISRQI